MQRQKKSLPLNLVALAQALIHKRPASPRHLGSNITTQVLLNALASLKKEGDAKTKWCMVATAITTIEDFEHIANPNAILLAESAPLAKGQTHITRANTPGWQSLYTRSLKGNLKLGK